MSTAVALVEARPQQLAPVASASEASPEWQQILREAEKLARSTLTPAHLKAPMPPDDGSDRARLARQAAWNQTCANCILVANQARRWGADVFAVAAETYVVQNKLGYQGKLIAAIVNSRGGLAEPLQALYSTGKGDGFAAVLYGWRAGTSFTLEERGKLYALLEAYADGEDQKANRDLAKMGVLTVRVSVGQCKTTNKMWHTDPEQKLFYTGSTKWARRHAPELMVGLLSDDDLDYIKDQERRLQRLQQTRVEALLSPSLDAGGTLPELPAPPPSGNGNGNGTAAQEAPGASDPPFNPPTPEEVAQHAEPEPERQPGDDIDHSEPSAADGWRRRIALADNRTQVMRTIPDLITLDDQLTAEEKAALRAECEKKAEELRGKRGERSNGGAK